MTTFDRMLEIVDHAHTTGIPLPMNPRRIVELEDAGYLVDLESGAVVAADGIAAMPTIATLVTHDLCVPAIGCEMPADYYEVVIE